MTIKWSVLTHIVLLVAAHVMSFMSCVCAGAVPVPSVRWELFLLQRVHAVSGEPVGGVLRLCGWAPPLCLQHVHAQQSNWLYLCFKNKRHTCKMPFSNQLDSKTGEKSYTCISWRGSWQESEDSAGETEDGSKPSVFLRTPNSELIFQKYLLLLMSTEATQFLIKLDFFQKSLQDFSRLLNLKHNWDLP